MSFLRSTTQTKPPLVLAHKVPGGTSRLRRRPSPPLPPVAHRMRVGPGTRSPTSPGGTSRMSSSTTRYSMVGMGRPPSPASERVLATQHARHRRHLGLAEHPRSRRRGTWPPWSAQSSDAGAAPPADPQRQVPRCFAGGGQIACHWVGTLNTTVARSRSHASSVPRRRRRRAGAAPWGCPARGWGDRPQPGDVEQRGRQEPDVTLVDRAHRPESDRRRTGCRGRASPLGRPVVPEVYMISAGVSSGTSEPEVGPFLGDQVLGRLVPVRVVPEHHHLADPVGHLPGGLDQRDQRRIRHRGRRRRRRGRTPPRPAPGGS